MINTNYVRSIMVLKGESARQYCKSEKIQESNFGLKLRGQREWKQSDIATFIKHYNLTPEQTVKAFFPECLGGEAV